MEKNPFAPLVSTQLLINILGHTLSEQEFSNLQKPAQFLTTTPGKTFFHSADSDSGIYIVLAGKVRLFNSAGDLLATLDAGGSSEASGSLETPCLQTGE